MVCRILIPQLRIESEPLQGKHSVLTTRASENSRQLMGN